MKDTRVSSISDTENLGVLVVDIRNRAIGGGDDALQPTFEGPVAKISGDRMEEMGARKPITPCAVNVEQSANNDTPLIVC